MEPLTYRSAGVDLEVYEQSMQRLPPLMRRTFSPRVIPWAGGFAGLFQLDFTSRLFARNYQEPVLVAGTDGVGTKLKVAQLAGTHDSVGIDLVAMCVNDILCAGAEPLFFLDYVALSRDDPALLAQIVSGVSAGCLQADCALLGGETAIMPDLYSPGDYDLAGFCVGVVEKRNIIDGSAIAAGDAIIGIASSGLHSNGYSLARRAVLESAGLQVNDVIEPLQATVAQVLLQPTRIYTAAVRATLRYYKTKAVVHGIAHITGGGLRENLLRITPKNIQLVINCQSWQRPPVFDWLQQIGPIDKDEMYRVFNMGIGLVLVVSAYYADSILRTLSRAGYPAWIIGEARQGQGDVELHQM